MPQGDDEVDLTGPESLTDQLVRALRGRIERGELRPRDKLPSEHELIERYGVSRITVRRALAYLASERGGRLIYPAKGRGWFVSDR